MLDLLMLYFFTDVCHIYYLYSAILAFIISLSFGYFFQKYLTFRDFSNKHLQQ
ncbi:MAG: GtrA family protein [bacterium]